jgi:predicted nucleic acid-binding protein
VKLITASVLKKAVSGKKVLIDTNIIIYLTDSVEPYAGLSRLLFEMVESGDTFGVISILTVAEVMQGPLKKGLMGIAFDVKEYLLNFPNTICQEVTSEVVGRVGKDDRVSWPKLRTIDSLIISCGLANDVDRIVSNDSHFKKALPSKLVLSFDKQ